jgi:D-galactarolactone cycloisomerase
VKITEITLDRLRLPLSPPLHAAWDPVPRRWFDATIVRVHTDEGVSGVGSGDTMDGFDAVRPLFVGQDPLDIARHVRAIETANFHGGRFWPLEAALWDVIGKVAGLPVATLFGNSARALPAYASSAEIKEPAERVEVTRGAQAAGSRPARCRTRCRSCWPTWSMTCLTSTRWTWCWRSACTGRGPSPSWPR